MELRKIFFTLSKKIENITVFLTRVGIRQMPFHFFLPLQKFKTIRIKPEKIPLPKQIVLTTYIQEFQRYFEIYLLYS